MSGRLFPGMRREGVLGGELFQGAALDPHKAKGPVDPIGLAVSRHDTHIPSAPRMER